MEPLNKEKHSMTLENPWKGGMHVNRPNVEDSCALLKAELSKPFFSATARFLHWKTKKSILN